MEKFKVGDKVIWADSLDGSSQIHTGILASIKNAGINSECKLVGELYPRYLSFMWPERVRTELELIIQKRKELKKQFDDSMKLIHELHNQITRGEK